MKAYLKKKFFIFHFVVVSTKLLTDGYSRICKGATFERVSRLCRVGAYGRHKIRFRVLSRPVCKGWHFNEPIPNL